MENTTRPDAARPGVRINNRHPHYKADSASIKRIVLKTLRYIAPSRPMEIEINFLNNAQIRSLNRKFKGSDRPTDVLSFGLDRREFGLSAPLGEVFISLDAAKGNSKAFGTGFAEEAVLYVIHALLHLSGYDDEKAPDRARMAKKEKEALKYLCRKEDLSKVLTRR